MHHSVPIFSWSFGVIGFSALLVVLYALAVGPLRGRFHGSEPVEKGKIAYFISGVVLLLVAMGSPLNSVAHHSLFSAHMLQQSILFFIVPPLMLAGLPAWLIRPVLQRKSFGKMISFLTHPIIALVTFNGALSFYHFPVIFDTFMSGVWYGTVFHWLLIAFAFLMWWVIACPVPEWNRLSELKKIAYIISNGLLLYPACAVIIFSKSLLYETYDAAPRLFSFLGPLDDQQLGGVIMKLMQEGVFVFALAVVFRQWRSREKNNEDDLNVHTSIPEVRS